MTTLQSNPESVGQFLSSSAESIYHPRYLGPRKRRDSAAGMGEAVRGARSREFGIYPSHVDPGPMAARSR